MSLARTERLQELLATRATQGLPDADSEELVSLLQANPSIQSDAFDLAAATLYLELASGDEISEQLPQALRQRLLTEGGALVRGSSSPADADNVTAFPDPVRSAPSSIGWWAAAACLLLAVSGWWPRLAPNLPRDPSSAAVDEGPAIQATTEGATTAELTSAQLRGELLADAADIRVLAWAPTEDSAAAGAVGDVVWSTERQQGFMRIARLEANDPAATQYQLWIFDAARDERYPVDGGIFDIPPGADEVVIPIDAKVFVNEPALFAVTVEPPGGVVVSDRERIVLVAQA